MGGAKRQLQEYEEFLVNRPHMNADTQANILAMAVEATRLDFERKSMQLEDLRSRQERRRISTGTRAVTGDLNAVSYTHLTLPTKRIV